MIRALVLAFELGIGAWFIYEVYGIWQLCPHGCIASIGG
jgi:hypothetical protein